jgi:hypothetical protein
LGNQDYNVEKIMSAGAEGLLFGGAIGGAGGALSGIFGKVKGVKGTAEAYPAEGFTPTERAFVRSNMLSRAEQEAIGLENIRLVMPAAMEKGIVPKDLVKAFTEGMPEKASKWRAWRDELGKSVTKHYDDADKIGKLDSTKLISESADYIGALRDKGGMYETIANNIERKYFGTFAHTANKLDDAGNIIATYGTPRAKDFKQLHNIISDIGSEIDRLAAKKDTVAAEALRDFYSLVKRNTTEAIGGIDPNIALSLKTTDKLYGAVSDFEKRVSPKALGQDSMATGVVEAHDIGFVAGGFATGMPVTGLAIGAGRFIGRELQKGYRLNNAWARALNDYRKASVTQAQAVSGAVTKAANKDAVRTSYVVPAMATQVTKAFNDRADETVKSVNSPELVVNRLAPIISAVATVDPVAARALPGRVLEDLNWLYKRLPPSPSPDSLIAIADRRNRESLDKLRVAPSVASAFVRNAKTLADPVAAVEEIPTKGVTPELIDVLNERRPKLREAVVARYEQTEWELAQKGQRMSYKSRIEATLLTGRAYDVTMTPEYIFQAQAMWDATRAADLAAQAGPSAETSKAARHKRLSTTRTSYQEGMERGD